jgi:elongator complex protein 4
MSFRKRNIGLGRTPIGADSTDTQPPAESGTLSSSAQQSTLPGLRPSPIDGRLTTSTGTSTLDALLAGHAGLALGHNIIFEENGTTDYAGSLLKYYAAEGIVQGHTLHIVGVREQWTKELPGLIGAADHGVEAATKSNEADKMKIAWRYEKLGRVGENAGVRGVYSPESILCPHLTEFVLMVHVLSIFRCHKPKYCKYCLQ